MRHPMPCHTNVAWRSGRLAIGALLLISGCQHYERQPVDLAAHRSSLHERGVVLGRIQEFLERLGRLGADAPATFSLEDGLAPAEGEVLALFYNAELRLARLEAGVALASYEHAGLWDDPVFGFDGAEILSPSGGPFELGLTLSLNVPVSGRLDVEKARAGAAYETELRRIVDAEWTTRAAVRRAWTDWVVAAERLDLRREAIDQIERITDITDRLESAGELGRVEGRLFRVELAERRAELVDAELSATAARTDLLGLMGLPPDTPIELTRTLPAADLPIVDDALDRLIERNTELAVHRAAYQVAEETLRLEIRKQHPDITIGSGFGNEGDDRLLLGFAVAVPILNANRQGIAEARARREVARANMEIAFERLSRQLAAARAGLESARAQRTRFESEIVPMLESQAEEVERIVELGDVDTFLLLQTVGHQLQAKSRLLELQRSELNHATTVARLLGPAISVDPAPVGAADASPAEEENDANDS